MDKDLRIAQLENEISSLKAQLAEKERWKRTEELSAINEELSASYEELYSTNEELHNKSVQIDKK